MTTILKWVPAALLGAIIPAIAFDTLLADWNFDIAPPWSWVMISIIPLASSTLLVLQGRWSSRVNRTACVILILHAAIMIVFGWWRYKIVGISLFLDLLLLAILLPAAIKEIPLGRFSKATIFWIAVLIGMGFPAALANSVIVMWRAEAIAGDQPYCIQYASQTDAFAYEPARTLFDLSALKMQQRQGTARGASGAWIIWQVHSILVVGDSKLSFFYWSYDQENFLDEMQGRKAYEDICRICFDAPKVFCTPKAHYARDLPVWWRAPNKFDTSIAGRQFSIPEVYRPRKNGEELVIDAAGPDFEAYDPDKNRLDQSWYDVRIFDASSRNLSSDLEQLLARRGLTSGEVKIESQFNLNRIHRGVSSGGVYTGYDDAGQLMTLINCRPADSYPSPKCRLMFLNIDVAFDLAIVDPSEWQAIEQRLAQVLVSFEVGRTDRTPER